MNFTDKEVLIRMNALEEKAYDRIKDKMKKAGLYKPEYEHMIQLLACNIVQYNGASDTERLKVTVNINSLSQQLFLTPKSAGLRANDAEEKKDDIATIMEMTKVS